ncbi:probable receptor-like protein kinase At5g24010 [Corylus avellana]|uniref:probable receptor-like protein kinase At5g24010 n=1 Tax=Corylus avellana TaxID=13451 RepID=UPI001E22A175|nr:probable receptor-like protein kinase At5g24010 [Corylus avellana]
MEKLQLHNTHIPLFALLLFLIHFSSLQFLSLAYTPPTKYFINCGSASNVNANLRNFVGDSNSSDLISASVSRSGKGSTVKDSNESSGASPLALYQTARIFRHNSLYEFNIEDYGTYFVRFHFFAFSSLTTQTDLSTALFDVWTYGFNFTPKSYSNSAIIEEFLLTINPGKFKVYFVPRGSSFAFINAIEVFLAPPDLISDEAPLIHVSPAALINNNYTGVLSKSLQSIYRINVGGTELTPDDDKLWRTWVPDDGYINNPGAARNSTLDYRPNYRENNQNINEFTAPNQVYKTAKEMNINSSAQSTQFNPFNITWSFIVSKSASHLVRVHFCDIISPSMATLKFNLYIYGNFGLKIDSYYVAVPFYFDFVVDSDESGLMNISIGPRNDSDKPKTAYLNGLEIKEILNNSGPVPIVIAPKNNHVFLVVGSVIGGLVLICILVVVLFLVFKSRKPNSGVNSNWSPVVLVFGGGSSHSRGTRNGSLESNLNLGLKMPFAEIQFVTNNFNNKSLIGKGGFGIVYSGTFRDGRKVAVKRSEPGSNQGLPEFHTEIMVLSKIRHRNLVQLIGYCDDRSEMILVYEFMENGTLREHLYASDKPPSSWKQRLEICIGAARGLQYLHKGSAGGTIHRDVKSTNILLNENLVAKVADFGLSKTGPLDETHVSTVVKGTFGYLDPEYFKSQQLTEKSDVYSFGVVLLEVLCARPPIDPVLQREQVNLAEWAMICKKKGLLEEIVDPSVKDQIDPSSLRKFIETAEKCLQDCGADRPNMADVLWDLEYALQLQQNAMRREPHEDSTTNSSVAFVMPNVQRFPSISMSFARDDTPMLMDDGSHVKASEVFSQMRIDDAR